MSNRKGNLRNEGERTGRPIRRIRELKAERQRSVWGGGRCLNFLPKGRSKDARAG